jgi:hypothetical protein
MVFTYDHQCNVLELFKNQEESLNPLRPLPIIQSCLRQVHLNFQLVMNPNFLYSSFVVHSFYLLRHLINFQVVKGYNHFLQACASS